MRTKRDAAAELAEKLVQVLEAQRGLGPASYPLTLRRLAELADPSAAPELIRKAAAKKKPFAERVVLVQAKNLDAPVFLAEDTDQQAASPPVLEFLLNSVCSPNNPTAGPTELKAKLPAKLQKPFVAALGRRLEENDLPPGVAVIPVKTKKRLHLLRYALPPAPEEVLAKNLMRVLGAQRSLGEDAYPLTLARLVELTQPGVAKSLVKGAIAQPAIQETVLLAVKNHPETPVALAEDGDLLAGSELLLETAVTVARTKTDHVCTLAKVKKKVIPDLQKPLEDAIRQRIETRSLPPTIGCLRKGKNWVLFLMGDVLTAPPRRTKPARSEEAPPVPGKKEEPQAPPSEKGAPPTLVPPAGAFAAAFDEAFQRLDRQKGSHNFVSLVDLRRALPMDRQTFDAGLRNLRQAGRYSLSGAEGRHGVSLEQQEAGIVEDGSLLLYVSRKLP
jgi:hypothetical protein